MNTTAYLLGAGASAKCIPVVNGMEKDMSELIDEISKLFPDGTNNSDPKTIIRREYFEGILPVIHSLMEACNSHYSIDTYAKKLSLTNSNAFKQLKLDLSLYFTLRQILKIPDKRYDNFFASIINYNEQLPKKVKVISWNYDFQMELSYSNFSNCSTLNASMESLGVVSPSNLDKFEFYSDRFNILKLNGSARFYESDIENFMIKGKSEEIENIRESFDTYRRLTDNFDQINCDLKFAWEKNNYVKLFNSFRPQLESITSLVVIGYSFPFFNRDVDIVLLGSMLRLQKIYVQDMNPEIIIERLHEIKDFRIDFRFKVELIAKKDVEQFFFPKELDIS